MKITEREVESYRRDGYACVEGAFGAEELARAAGWVDELQDWPETNSSPGLFSFRSARSSRRFLRSTVATR